MAKRSVDQKKSAAMLRIEAKAEEVKNQDRRKDDPPKQMFLPGMDEVMRAMPNHIGRSSLYAPVARGRRKFHQESVLASRNDALITYTGEQLDEADADLSYQLIYEARLHPLGVPVPVNRAALLAALGRGEGKSQYDWLHRRMKAMTVATMFIEAKKPDGSTKYAIGKTEAFHILQRFFYDDDLQSYVYILDPQWRTMFSNREYALLDWGKRLKIGRGQDMAKTLQRLVATSSDSVQRYELAWLKDKMQYTGRMRDFKIALIASVAELERLEIVLAGKLEISTKGKEQLRLDVKAVPE